MMSSSSHIMCQACEKPFNLSNKMPLLVSCCDDTLCKKCWTQAFNAGSFSCPFKCGNAGVGENPQQPKINVIVRKLIAKNPPSELECSGHPGEMITFYNYETETYICGKCEK